GERKNVEGEPFARKQPEKPGQLGEARLLVVPFVAVVVVVILRRRAEPGPEIVEARRGAREFELEAAELDVAGLLGERDFEKIEIVGPGFEALDHRRQKNRRAVA